MTPEAPASATPWPASPPAYEASPLLHPGEQLQRNSLARLAQHFDVPEGEGPLGALREGLDSAEEFFTLVRTRLNEAAAMCAVVMGRHIGEGLLGGDPPGPDHPAFQSLDDFELQLCDPAVVSRLAVEALARAIDHCQDVRETDVGEINRALAAAGSSPLPHPMDHLVGTLYLLLAYAVREERAIPRLLAVDAAGPPEWWEPAGLAWANINPHQIGRTASAAGLGEVVSERCEAIFRVEEAGIRATLTQIAVRSLARARIFLAGGRRGG